MGDGVKGTVTPLGSLFSPEEARKAARRVEEAVVQRGSELRRLQGFVSENSALISLVRSLPDELSHEIMVPFGGAAFFPGRLIHTNEFLVLLGDGYYAERTAKQTTDILHRRGKALEAQVEALKATMLDLEAEAKFFNSTAEEAFEGIVEIREEYVEEPEKNSLSSDTVSDSLHSGKNENLQKFDEDEEYARIMARIEELERMEELENGNTSKDNTQENEDTVVHDGDGGNKAGDEDEDIETKQKPKDTLQKASNQKVLSSFISHQTGNISKQQLKEEILLREHLSNSNMQFPVEAHSFSNKELSVGKEKTASSPCDARLSVSNIEDSPHETTRQTLNPVSSGHKAFSGSIVELDLGPQSIQSSKSTNLSQAFTGSIVERDLGPQPIQSSKSTNLSQAFTGSIVEHNIGPQPIQSSKNTNLSQSSAPSSTKPVSRFKMQKGNH